MKIAVIGAGLIGKSWAVVFARAGLQVQLWDGLPEVRERALSDIAKTMDALHQMGLMGDPEKFIKFVTVLDDVAEAVKGVSYVQENLPEVLEIKRDIFSKLLAATADDVVIATSTSGIKMSDIASEMKGRERCLVSHPVNPPHLVPLVEICGASFTDQKVVNFAFDLMKQVNQKPIKLNKEIDGFILNRLQGALLREAFWLYEQGYADGASIDLTISDGLGLRWSFMGPFETIDLNAPKGLADYCARYGQMYADMASNIGGAENWSEPLVANLHNERREKLDIADIQKRSQWRDQRLMALVKHKRDSQI